MISTSGDRHLYLSHAPSRCEPVEDAEYWDAFLADDCQGSFLQSERWGAVKAGFGWEPLRLAVNRRGRLVAGAQVLFRKLPIGTLAYVPRGPLVDYADAEACQALFAGLDRAARERGAFCLKVEPDEPGSPLLTVRLQELGFRPSAVIQPRSTLVVDLSAGPAETWERVSAKVRYNVRLAIRRGVRVVEGGAADLSAFCQLLDQTSQRAGFPTHDASYYEAVWRELGARGQARLLVAQHEGQRLAAALDVRVGERAFHVYAASASEGRNLKPNDLLQWEAIRRAQASGCRSYDLWGVPDAVGRAAENGEQVGESTDDELWGVYQFKRGFGGEVVRFAGAFDRVYSPKRYWLWRVGQRRARRLTDAGSRIRSLLAMNLIGRWPLT